MGLGKKFEMFNNYINEFLEYKKRWTKLVCAKTYHQASSGRINFLGLQMW